MTKTNLRLLNPDSPAELERVQQLAMCSIETLVSRLRREWADLRALRYDCDSAASDIERSDLITQAVEEFQQRLLAIRQGGTPCT